MFKKGRRCKGPFDESPTLIDELEVAYPKLHCILRISVAKDDKKGLSASCRVNSESSGISPKVTNSNSPFYGS